MVKVSEITNQGFLNLVVMIISTMERYSHFILGQETYSNFLPSHTDYYFETRKDSNYLAKEIKVQRR